VDAEETFLTQLAEEIAQRVVALVIPRLPRPNLIHPRYMTPTQAGQYIGHSPSSVHYLISKSFFPIIKKDRLVLIDREDLDKALARLKR
jgi:hypothetical protein